MATDSGLFLDKRLENDQPSLHFSEYWGVVVKRRRLIILGVIVALAAAGFISFLSKPLFRATVLLKVEREQSSAVDLGEKYSAWDPDFLPTQRDLMESREVAERVVKRLRLMDNPAFATPKSGLFSDKQADAADTAAMTVQKSVQTTPRRGTSLVELSVVQPDPKLAPDMANALAQAYIDWNIESKYQVVEQANRFLTSQIEQLKGELQVKENELQAYGRQKDIVSTDPGSNATMQKLESFNTDYAEAVTDRVAKEARFYELQNARPETIADNLSSGLVSQLRNDQAKLERDYAEKLNVYKPNWPAMQQARAQIEKIDRAGGLKTIVITSVMPGEGKTTTAANLAVVLAQLGKRVLLVDADLHKPRLHEMFEISNRVGLVSVLAENADVPSVVVPALIPGLFIVPSGPSSPNPSGLLSSDSMKAFLDTIRLTFDFIILDTPPVGPVADAIILGYQSDGVVLCVRGGKTSRERVIQVRDRLVRSNVRLLGVLLNNLSQSSSEYAEYYGAYRGTGYGENFPTQAATG